MCQFIISGVYFFFGLFWLVFGIVFLLEFVKELLMLIFVRRGTIYFLIKRVFYMCGMIILFSLMSWFGLKVLYGVVF